MDNLIKLKDKSATDRKLAYDISQVFFKQKTLKRNPCATVYKVEADFKQLVASKMR